MYIGQNSVFSTLTESSSVELPSPAVEISLHSGFFILSPNSAASSLASPMTDRASGRLGVTARSKSRLALGKDFVDGCPQLGFLRKNQQSRVVFAKVLVHGHYTSCLLTFTPTQLGLLYLEISWKHSSRQSNGYSIPCLEVLSSTNNMMVLIPTCGDFTDA